MVRTSAEGGVVGDGAAHVLERYVDGAERGDATGDVDLVRGVPAESVGVDLVRVQQADPVVVPKRLRGEPDAAARTHPRSGAPSHQPPVAPPCGRRYEVVPG